MRHPAHIVAARPPRGRQQIWTFIRTQRERFTIGSLSEASGAERGTIRLYLECLIAAGIVCRIEESKPILGAGARRAFAVYSLIRDCGHEAPRVDRHGQPVKQGLGREQMWRTMRILSGDWSYRDLAIAATTEDAAVSEDSAREYCDILAKAGYLQVIGDEKPCRYRFLRSKYTGPKPPQIQRMQTLWDPNIGMIVWHPEVPE